MKCTVITIHRFTVLCHFQRWRSSVYVLVECLSGDECVWAVTRSARQQRRFCDRTRAVWIAIELQKAGKDEEPEVMSNSDVVMTIYIL